MLVKELVKKLLEFDQDVEITISDGWDCVFYRGSYAIELQEDFETKRPIVDIGIGGCKEETS